MIEVQRLAPGDLASMRALNALFSRIFADPGSYGANPPDEDYLRDALSRRGVVALVARNGAEIVGGLTAYELPKLEQRRSEFYIYDLAVAETHRRRGIATMLIEEIRRIAREAGGWVVYVQADYGDDPAIALYTKLGMREDVMHFDIAP